LSYPWKDLPTYVPIIGTSFAFAYDVGYFASFDINWFTFFSLPDHILFALRALPVALGASVIFIIGLRFSEILESRKEVFIISSLANNAAPTVFYSWIVVLIGAAIWAAWRHHNYGIFFCFTAVAAGAAFHHFIMVPDEKLQDTFSSKISLSTIVYWTIAITALSIMLGYGTTKFWRESGSVISEILFDGTEAKGYIMHAGTQGLMFYDCNEKGIRIVMWKSVTEVRLQRPDETC
jgi:hypothetical protein